jgi:2-C-methyl-D-erythritol 4-phosphate cytidylyltransferase
MSVESSMSPNASVASRFYVVIPCAGSGSRAGTVQPKQYQQIAGMPMVLHTLKAFENVPRIARGLLVLAPDDVHMREVLLKHPQPLFDLAYVGGASRADSVLAGLRTLRTQGAQDTDWVLVHDAARCLVTSEQINALIDACQADPVGGLLAHPLADTLKQEASGRVSQTVDRADKWLAQTPQMFHLADLVQALESAGSSVTDEASAIEASGRSPKLVPASSHNFKVTYSEDFALAEAILKTRSHD